MPKIDKSILNEELPTTNKVTVSTPPAQPQEPVQINEAKTSISIYDLVKKEKKKTREQIGVTLDKEIVDKLKTVTIDSNITMSKLFENLLTPLLEDVQVNPNHVRKFNEKNKLKGRKKEDKTK